VYYANVWNFGGGVGAWRKEVDTERRERKGEHKQKRSKKVQRKTFKI